MISGILATSPPAPDFYRVVVPARGSCRMITMSVRCFCNNKFPVACSSAVET